MKHPFEWDISDVLNLITNSVEESLTLDYKASPSLNLKNEEKKKELCKDISAFANTVGGTIIYGIEEENNKPVRIDDGISKSDTSREQIDRIIRSSINPIIDNIRINPIQLPNVNHVYIVQIPKSERAPHMAKDKKILQKI